jgi:hypothetical protein
MAVKQKPVPVSGMIILLLVLINTIAIRAGYFGNEAWYWVLTVTLPLLIVAILNVRQRRHAVLRNFPLIGYLRYFFESIRPEIRQYFFESDLDGKRKRNRSIRHAV